MSADDWLTDPLVLARFVHLAACMAAAGTATFAMLAVDGEGAATPDMDRLRRGWRAIVSLAALVAFVSGAAWLVVVAANIVGAPLVTAVRNGGLWSVAIDTQFGHLAIARLALALLLLAPAWPMRLRLGVALTMLGLIAPAGHAGAQPGSWGDVHLAADVLHLLAAGGWLGGLLPLAMLLACARRKAPAFSVAAARSTARFSLLGAACVATLIISGIANSWFLLSAPADLVTTTYGRVLAIKIGLFAAMLGFAAVNRFHLTPRLPEPLATRGLQRNSLIELALGLGVLFLAAILGTLSPSAHQHGHTEIPKDAAFVHIHTNIVMADVTIDPGRAGPVQIGIHLAKEDFTDFIARGVQLELRAPETETATITRAASADGETRWRIDDLDLPRPGIWTIRLGIGPQHAPIVMLDAPIVIAP